ncbi:class D beta-lactamase [Shouchella patagoniensis]|uniref:class D beta-lactamase n=1 Tax=Shouchella patagoniensis TaxID=228576 RepID=UPI0009952539|nr:class D beta-lactamase [Shouchella patagoniensis]
MKKLIITVFLAAIGTAFLFFREDPEPIEASNAENLLEIGESKAAAILEDKNAAFVLSDVTQRRSFIYNKDRAYQSFSPQSTFKILNALIGLDTEVVEDEYVIKNWDGVKREIDVWNQDHTLGSGLRDSVVWYYQELAREIGEAEIKEGLVKANYGNKDISGGIDEFWLSSTLQISPVEQAHFLAALYREELPFDEHALKTVKRMMIEEEGDRYTLYGKTGQGDGIGWYVGFVVKGGQTYSFATNLDGTSAEAKEATQQILNEFQLVEDQDR